MRKLSRTEVKFVAVCWLVATIVFILVNQLDRGSLSGGAQVAVDVIVGFCLVLGAFYTHRTLVKRRNRSNSNRVKQTKH